MEAEKTGTSCDKLPKPTLEGIEALLAGTYVEGIGKVFASRICETLGSDVLHIIMSSPERLLVVPGMGESKARMLEESIRKCPCPVEMLAFLYSAGLSDNDIDKILSHYGKLTCDVILHDPYEMVEDVWKLSFFTADKIGKALGIVSDDPRRLRGALLTAVKLYAEKGNIYATENEAVSLASRITGVTICDFPSQLKVLVEEGRLIYSRDCYYLPPYYKAEKEGAEKIVMLVKSAVRPEEIDIRQISDAEGNLFSREQMDAIMAVLLNPITIITGGPGTGKTTTVKGMIELLRAQDKNVILVAPTGRAAKRMTDMTGFEAMTIHRLLGYRRGEGYRNKKFNADILIIDEASMLEQVLFNHLLQALQPGTKIVIIGDVDQLPPIGAGDVLRDMIDSGTIPVIHLSENFRQAKGSMIASNAMSIKDGQMPGSCYESDFELIFKDNVKEIRQSLLELISTTIPDKYNIDSKEIQVVTPMQEGPLGAKQLNELIQQKVNPSGPMIKKGLKTFRLGDRVMQKSNSSERHIYNGEAGWISKIDEATRSIEVTFFDGKTSCYSYKDFGELSLAYATTVHKLQGCETDYMIMPVAMSHGPLLYRNLLYTAVSRAKKLCVIIGEERAIRLAVRNENPIKRHTNFKARLREKLPWKSCPL